MAGFPRLVQFLLELVRGEFYGTVIITFRKGVLGLVKVEQSYEAGQLPIKDPESLAVLMTGRSA